MLNDLIFKYIKFNEEGITLLKYFLENAGESLSKFRYFDSRNIDCISNHLVTLLLMFNNSPIGYGHLDKENEIIWLGICISEKFTNKGLGTIILDRLLSDSKKLNIAKVNLTVDKDNIIAIRLYLRIGFKTENANKTDRFLLMSYDNKQQ